MRSLPASSRAHRAGPRVGAALVALAALLAGCSPADVPGPPAVAGTDASSALNAVALLTVKGRAPKTGYEREQFGQAWSDVDRNGCDTRNDVLQRDLTGVVVAPGTQDCVVASGTLADPYSGESIAFVRGQDTSGAVQIDHVVALSDAWQKGAQQWDDERRTAFANDPLNLLAVDGPLNGAKGDGDTATWLPPNTAFRCAYVARQVAVKVAYGVWVTSAERDAMSSVLSSCPDEPLPAGSQALATADPGAVPGAAEFESCAAARAAGAAPVRAGDAGYGPHLDGDGDGTACE